MAKVSAIIKIHFRSWGATEEEVTATITNVTPKFAEGTLQSVKSC